MARSFDLSAALAALGFAQDGADPDISLWLKPQGLGAVVIGASADIDSLVEFNQAPLGLVIQGTGYPDSPSLVLRSAGESGANGIYAYVSGGTLAAPTVTQVSTTPFVGQDSLLIGGFGFDGETWVQSCGITLQNGPGTISPGIIPGQVILTASSSAGPLVALTLMGDYGIQAILPTGGFAVSTAADDGINFEHITTKWNSTTAEMGPVAGGTGTLRSLKLTGAGVMFPSSDPHVVGAYWDNGTDLVRSAG